MTRNQSTERLWIKLDQGGTLDLLNPDPYAWGHSEIPRRLSRIPRWAGSSKWPFSLSVAQHSLLTLAIRKTLGPLSRVEALRELLHDAEEGFMGFDPLSPIKPILGHPLRDLNNRLSSALMIRYDIPAWNVCTFELHKLADNIAAASEAYHCVGWKVSEIRGILGITEHILEEDPLFSEEVSEAGLSPWEPWPPLFAEQMMKRAMLSMLEEVCVEQV